ncbi:PREDICTED: transient receptor potential cation channel subfamily A member 1 homolog [Amphimedon queenslandica]|uniref:Ion transport domain-containing protein n=1 Tax=Amphimedon queenslandica TaxID=400682 RepID=A0AAN0JAA9_AMPQE|nr:PREDICTED: transient receptor potential cation channel subfamily A member 1 homolog [Amphimedon queenslandica]|eukprot:XP_019853990.1 PREDICTED: transient receptor potential cation channel subfamily A member 1 homolog [Amphimedon queenslandica]
MFYILFLILLTSFALTVQSPNSNLCMKVFENDNDTVIDCFPEESLLSQRYVSFVSICLIFYSLIMLLSKLLAQLILRRWQSILEVFLFIFIVIFAFVRSNQCYCTESWQWQIGVIAVFFSWIVLIFSIRRLPVVGIYVVMYITILYNLIRKVVVLALLLVFAFAFPFYMIFYDIQGKLEGIRTPFNTPWRTIYKTITMAAGHLRLDSLLHQDNQINSPDVQYPVVAFSLLIVFVVLMPILFINLLTSLAVGDIVQEIEKKSDTYRLRLKLEFTLPVEKFLRFKIMKKFKDSLDLWQTGNKKNSDKQELSDEQKLSDKQKLSDRFKKYINDWSKRIEISTKTELPATIADVKNHIKPLSEEVKDLNNSVDQLLSIVRSMRNESPGRRNI